MVCRTVTTVCKYNHGSNPIGCQSENSILDIHLCNVKFLGGEISLVTATAIVQAMYAQCNFGGNEYSQLEYVVDV